MIESSVNDWRGKWSSLYEKPRRLVSIANECLSAIRLTELEHIRLVGCVPITTLTLIIHPTHHHGFQEGGTYMTPEGATFVGPARDGRHLGKKYKFRVLLHVVICCDRNEFFPKRAHPGGPPDLIV